MLFIITLQVIQLIDRLVLQQLKQTKQATSY